MAAPKSRKRLLLQGNEAIVHGALAAGCRFFAGYPITPASEISELLSVKLPQVGGTFIQMEDEIASMGAVIGASLAGVKSMTATSGPGFSLMQENLGYACITEVPCVIVNVMRGGPSTGLPTNVAQGDVLMARWGTHGDHPIIVLAVSSVNDCFSLTVRAFSLSEKYRIPVIILSDEVVAHTRECITLPDSDEVRVVDRISPNVPPEWYKPYANNNRGVPDMAAFGEGYRHHVTGLVHDERGFPTKNHLMEDAEVCVIAYGSVSRSALMAIKDARAQGIKAGLVQLITLFPVPRKEIDAALRQCKAAIIPELNMGQMSREINRINQSGARIIKYNRIDGQMITPDEITKQILYVS